MLDDELAKLRESGPISESSHVRLLESEISFLKTELGRPTQEAQQEFPQPRQAVSVLGEPLEVRKLRDEIENLQRLLSEQGQRDRLSQRRSRRPSDYRVSERRESTGGDREALKFDQYQRLLEEYEKQLAAQQVKVQQL